VPPNFSKGSGGTEALTYLVRVASPHAHAAKQVPPNFSKGSGGTEALTYLVRVASPHAPKKLRSQNHPPHI